MTSSSGRIPGRYSVRAMLEYLITGSTPRSLISIHFAYVAFVVVGLLLTVLGAVGGGFAIAGSDSQTH